MAHRCDTNIEVSSLIFLENAARLFSSALIHADNIIWHVFHARHIYDVKVVKIIYTNLLKASLNEPNYMPSVLLHKLHGLFPPL